MKKKLRILGKNKKICGKIWMERKKCVPLQPLNKSKGV